MYMEGIGVGKDEGEALRWYKRAADQGNAIAALNLAENYLEGRGAPADSTIAASWFRKAADQGQVTAMRQFALMVLSGDGVRTDAKAGVDWLNKAANMGDGEAQFVLGTMYGAKQARPEEHGTGLLLDVFGEQGGHAGADEARSLASQTLTAAQRAQQDLAIASFQPK
ncbi:sel1 repeat family protein [Massilia sp. B-10]|nr:sel1 repeat family protein [Massilia sp. B-10]